MSNVWRSKVWYCAHCGKKGHDNHPPYLITRGNAILGPYHTGCVDAATRIIDPEEWRRRMDARARAARGEAPR